MQSVKHFKLNASCSNKNLFEISKLASSSGIKILIEARMTKLVTRLQWKINLITRGRILNKVTTTIIIIIISSSSGDFEALIFFKLNVRNKNILHHHQQHPRINCFFFSLIATRNEIIIGRSTFCLRITLLYEK